MITSILSIIKSLNVIIITGDFEEPGRYIPDWNIIFLDQDLSETEHKIVLLHELGHAAKHQGETELYNATINMKSKMEYEANYFMIGWLFDDYMKVTDIEPEDINIFDFMRQNAIPDKDEAMVREIIANYDFSD